MHTYIKLGMTRDCKVGLHAGFIEGPLKSMNFIFYLALIACME